MHRVNQDYIRNPRRAEEPGCAETWNCDLQLVWLFFGEDIHRQPIARSVAISW